MTEPAGLFAALCALLLAVQLLTLAIAGWRLSRRARLPTPTAAPPVSIVVPVKGVEAYTDETLARAFALDWPAYELIFCVADAADPVISRVKTAMRHAPRVAARILVGDDRISGNPKLNNCIKGWRAARHDWVVLADSNVLMPPDYVQSMMAGWRRDTGLVCSTPIGTRPSNFWAEVECAWLNTLQARWQYFGEQIGFGFAQGKSMLWNKPMLDANGGIEALAAEIAEDAAATKLVNRLGLKVHLVDSPFEQGLGIRRFAEIWSRQARWARLRRVTFPAIYAPELFLGAVAPMLLAMAAAGLGDFAPWWTIALLPAMYLPEYALAAAKGWHRSPRYLAAMLVRDLMIPAVWLSGWLGAHVEWRGNAMEIRPGEQVLSAVE